MKKCLSILLDVTRDIKESNTVNQYFMGSIPYSTVPDNALHYTTNSFVYPYIS